MRKVSAGMMCLAAVALMALAGCATDQKSGQGGAKAGKFCICVNCGGEKEYTDEMGRQWLPDQLFEAGAKWGAVGGKTVVRDYPVAGTKCPDIYKTEHYSMEAYKFAVPDGKYTVRLHFSEDYEAITAEGERVFSVTLQGKKVITDLDPLKEAKGPRKPVVKEFKGVAPVNGEIVIGFTPKVQNPQINGIEILGE
ncbi:MAG: malectin [Candidatus Sumerlaeota bacterium]|nr:malectin [Candidatus Sumerlaeota bacterium]